jgi:hypothetical protein
VYIENTNIGNIIKIYTHILIYRWLYRPPIPYIVGVYRKYQIVTYLKEAISAQPIGHKEDTSTSASGITAIHGCLFPRILWAHSMDQRTAEINIENAEHVN